MFKVGSFAATKSDYATKQEPFLASLGVAINYIYNATENWETRPKDDFNNQVVEIIATKDKFKSNYLKAEYDYLCWMPVLQGYRYFKETELIPC